MLTRLLGAIDRDGIETLVKAGARLWARYGCTTATEGRALAGAVDVMKEVAAEGGFAIDVNAHMEVLANRGGPNGTAASGG